MEEKMKLYSDHALISTGNRYESLPEGYKRPLAESPNLSQVVEIPVIDLGCSDPGEVVRQIGEASRSYSFFQVINHGISGASMEQMMRNAREFYHLPMEEKMKLYSDDDPAKTTRLSFNVKKETVHNWRDYLRLHCYPLQDFVPERPSSPSAFREVEYIERVVGEQGQHMAINFYPRSCPQPDLTYGLPGHTEPEAFFSNIIGDQIQRRRNSGRIAAYSQRPVLPIVVTHNTALAATYDHDRAQILETALKIGIWTTGISIPAFISMSFLKGTILSGFPSTLLETLLAVTCVSAMFTSSILGGILLILSIFHSKFPLSIPNIKTIIAFAVASMGTVICTGFALKLCNM